MTISEIQRRLQGRVPRLQGAREHCAVLVPLVEWAGDVYLLFEVRAQGLSRQPGEVCFPGGRMEPGEDPRTCALRETWEELGILPQAIQPLAELDYHYHQAGFLTYPILARVEAGAVMDVAPNGDEVAETFLVPLEHFRTNPPEVYTCALRPEVGEDFPYDRIGFPQGYPWRGGRMELPIWTYKGHPIWGLTARIVQGLLTALGDGRLPAEVQ